MSETHVTHTKPLSRMQSLSESRGRSKVTKSTFSDSAKGYFENGCRKNVHTTILKSNMGYDQYAVPDTVAVESSVVAFLLAFANIRLWPLSQAIL